MRESNQKPVKTGIPNRKKTAFATALSCKNLYFPAPTKPAESTACRFFTGDYRRPACTFVLPAPRVPDGLTISRFPSGTAGQQGAADLIPDVGQGRTHEPSTLDPRAGAIQYQSAPANVGT